MSIYSNIINKENNKLLKNLSKKIISEHFKMTLISDRNINYLWHLYENGSKKDEYKKPFILACELNLLKALDVITEDETQRLLDMLFSEDQDNHFLALLSIKKFRDIRIKTHGAWSEKLNVSDLFKDVVNKYPITIVNLVAISKKS